MENLLIVLGVLFAALFIIVPLVERFGKPVDNEKAQKYTKIMGLLLGIMMLALVIRSCTGV
ncbi:Uncharacterised protein [BD1-7 clade bacterium]|uniref:Uncharacterized protein n=1 Tax=BD1-7 clade bacterium TaxID=2029982 RepID=A0A5S9N2T3_9GAMM|nr:Uncharacterised protein [BD1-7 clade bacterium]CAA0082960.1 Uncharacterised protein [BD1-7 clade bacterium]